MNKIYRDISVLDAAMNRLDIIFKDFPCVYFAVSGGKDSSVMLQLAARAARKHHKKLSVLFIDLEGQYAYTIAHMEELLEDVSDVLERAYWIALPLALRNAVSVIQPKWICWDKDDKKRWIREMPDNQWVIHEDNIPADWDWFKKGMEFEEFIIEFAIWMRRTSGLKTACGIAIRSNESLNRLRTITSAVKEMYKEYHWTTRVKSAGIPYDIYNFFPLYDWHTEDIWGAVATQDLKFNYVYELMYKNGLSIHEQRLCQPYGDDQRNGLDQFRVIEPETWEKVLNRVHGANFGNIYCRSSLLGNIRSEKPPHMTWEQYSVFLLESLGLYAPELRDHYYGKICTFFRWYKKTEGLSISDIKEEEDKKLESARKIASWRRIARAIEKNDFWMKRLSFSQTKSDVKKLYQLKEKYKDIIYGSATDDKHLKALAQEMNKDGD